MTDLSRMTDDQLLALYQQGQPLAAPQAPLTADQLARAGQQRQQADQPLNWSDVPGQAARNFIPSAVQFGKDIVEPFLSPIETVKNIGTIGQGYAQKLGVSIGPDDPQATAAADAVSGHFADRYGSAEGFKRALATDPVGVAGDLSTVISGGSGLAARVPGVAGRATRAASAAARAIDPLTLPLMAGGEIARTGLGLTTGVGRGAVQGAYEAGRSGGFASETLRDAMRGNTPLEDVVLDARGALDSMRRSKQDAYRNDMSALSRDRTVLDFSGIDRAISNMSSVGTFRGTPIQRSADRYRDRIINEIDYWKAQDPATYHTPEGLDALKKSIADIGNDIPIENRAARLIVKQATDAIKQTIQSQSPGYANTMRAYERASRMMDELTRTFNLGERGSVDSALRKLTSAMRNNVNTNFGRRTQLLQELERQRPGITNQITGASLNSWEPRGLARLAAGAAGIGQVGGAIMSGGLAPLATIPAQLAISSPRVVGEAARFAGATTRRARPRAVAEASRQYGRNDGEPPRRVYIDTSQFR